MTLRETIWSRGWRDVEIFGEVTRGTLSFNRRFMGLEVEKRLGSEVTEREGTRYSRGAWGIRNIMNLGFTGSVCRRNE